MARKSASKLRAGFKNRIENVAIVGAGGRSGQFIAEALIKGGKHRVTAITRPDSTSKIPDGIHEVRHVNYDSRLSLVEGLRGQDALIVTISNVAPKESQIRLIDAALEAGVKFVLPNEWGIDLSDEQLVKDSLIGERLLEVRKHIEEVGVGGKMHWIGVACGFWYEFSLAGTEARYGFDFDKKTVTFFDDGETKITTSTLPRVGEAVAKLLALKVLPENETDTGPNLSQYEDRSVCITSFCVSQRDMLDSVLRVTGDSEEDWTISYEDAKLRYDRGLKLWKDGNWLGLGILLYSRVFFKNGGGDFSAKVDNDALGLSNEDLDAATKVAVEMAERGENNAIH